MASRGLTRWPPRRVVRPCPHDVIVVQPSGLQVCQACRRVLETEVIAAQLRALQDAVRPTLPRRH
jgi:hypothetical protein